MPIVKLLENEAPIARPSHKLCIKVPPIKIQAAGLISSRWSSQNFLFLGGFSTLGSITTNINNYKFLLPILRWNNTKSLSNFHDWMSIVMMTMTMWILNSRIYKFWFN